MISASPLRVATAVSDPYEAALVGGLDGEPAVRVVRRCADVAEALACAAAGLVQAVVVSADVRGLDAAALELLEHHGCGVVALLDGPPDDHGGHERRLRQAGVSQVLPAGAGSAAVVAAVRAAVETAAARGSGAGAGAASLADPRSVARRLAGADGDLLAPAAAGGDGGAEGGGGPPTSGRVVAVWGPVGAPGRTTLAVELAAELAGGGRQVLLVDADTYGASIAQRLALLDESAAVAAACRAADRGRLDPAELARLAPTVLPRLRVLTGLLRADRWPEVRATALATVLERGRALADWVVVDTGFSLEQDEELAYDTVAPRRNQATLAALAAADLVVVVGAADPVGLQRLVRALRELADAGLAAAPPVVVANRVRAGAVGARPGRQVREALQRYAGIDDVVLVPDDPGALDAAVLAGRTLGEHARSSPVRGAVQDLVVRLRALGDAPDDGAHPSEGAPVGLLTAAH